MKNLFFSSILIYFAFLSCRNNDLPVQQIDQVLNIYIDSAGQDMINNTIEGSYTNIRWNDINGLVDNSPVNFSNRKDIDTVNFMEYVAGARRIAIDSAGDSKTYESRINLFLTKKIDETTTGVGKDLMVIQYTSTPEIFQVSKVFYNGIQQFTKVTGEPNVIRIQK